MFWWRKTWSVSALQFRYGAYWNYLLEIEEAKKIIV